MAALITLVVITILFGVSLGIFLAISFAIRREDRTRNSLRFDAANSSARAARALVGISSSRWD
jgi:MFS superfamily sulfate permease-like transporter